MDNQESIHEIEAIGCCLPWAVYHLLLLLFSELRDVIDGFEGVLGVGDAERNFELKLLNQLLFEVVFFNHQKISHRLVSYFES